MLEEFDVGYRNVRHPNITKYYSHRLD